MFNFPLLESVTLTPALSPSINYGKPLDTDALISFFRKVTLTLDFEPADFKCEEYKKYASVPDWALLVSKMIEEQFIYPKRIIIKNMKIFISKEKGAQQPMLDQLALI